MVDCDISVDIFVNLQFVLLQDEKSETNVK
jgi:hypothetical protein